MTDIKEILDLTYLAEAADGDKDFIVEILGDYFVEMGNHLNEMDQLLSGEDLRTLTRAAHTIKGASANVGAARVRKSAAVLEKQATTDSIVDGTEQIAQLRLEISEVRELIDRVGVNDLLKAVG